MNKFCLFLALWFFAASPRLMEQSSVSLSHRVVDREIDALDSGPVQIEQRGEVTAIYPHGQRFVLEWPRAVVVESYLANEERNAVAFI